MQWNLIPKVYINFVGTRPKLLWAFVIVSITFDLVTNHFIGGQIAEFGGRVQAVCLILTIHFAVSFYLYRDYRNENIKTIMISCPVTILSAFVFILLSIFLLYLVYFFFIQST